MILCHTRALSASPGGKSRRPGVLGLWRDEVEVEHVMLYALGGWSEGGKGSREQGASVT